MGEKKTHWKQLINPEYIGAYSLQPGEDLTVVMQNVERRDVTGEGGVTNSCSIVTLQGQKPMILNSDKQNTIQGLYGPYIEDWPGKAITIYASTTIRKKKTVECLRIRPRVPNLAPPSITEARFNKAVEAVKAGQYSKMDLLRKYTLTDKQKEEAGKL